MGVLTLLFSLHIWVFMENNTYRCGAKHLAQQCFCSGLMVGRTFLPFPPKSSMSSSLSVSFPT